MVFYPTQLPVLDRDRLFPFHEEEAVTRPLSMQWRGGRG